MPNCLMETSSMKGLRMLMPVSSDEDMATDISSLMLLLMDGWITRTSNSWLNLSCPFHTNFQPRQQVTCAMNGFWQWSEVRF